MPFVIIIRRKRTTLKFTREKTKLKSIPLDTFTYSLIWRLPIQLLVSAIYLKTKSNIIFIVFILLEHQLRMYKECNIQFSYLAFYAHNNMEKNSKLYSKFFTIHWVVAALMILLMKWNVFDSSFYYKLDFDNTN